MKREQFESICKNIPMLAHYLSFMTFRTGANEYQLTIFSKEYQYMETHLNGAWRFYQGIAEQKMLIAPLELDDDSARKLTEDSWDMGNHGLDLDEYSVEQVAPYREQWIQNYSKHYKKKHKEFIDQFRKLYE